MGGIRVFPIWEGVIYGVGPQISHETGSVSAPICSFYILEERPGREALLRGPPTPATRSLPHWSGGAVWGRIDMETVDNAEETRCRGP